jgi:general secretion pathway protein A
VYEAFFSLEDSPFVLTPDPRFLLRSKGHHEILGTLLYGITSQKGLMALIGDVGTGKTTLCRALLRELPKEVQSALVLNPHLSDAELIGTILDDLGIERRGTTKGELMTELSQHLLAAGSEGKTVVVILDEAQQMSVEALEQIRILSTLETATRKLLQIVLVGQPELEEKLARRELRQLDQRIGIRCHLKPLTRKDTLRYIEHRLRIAGLPGALPFTRPAMARIFRYSRGIPRVINLVCDRALMAAFSARAREVSPVTVRRAIRNLEGETRRRRRLRRPQLPWGRMARTAAMATAAGVVLLAGVAAAGYWNGRGGLFPSSPVAKFPSPGVALSVPGAAPAGTRPSPPAQAAVRASAPAPVVQAPVAAALPGPAVQPAVATAAPAPQAPPTKAPAPPIPPPVAPPAQKPEAMQPLPREATQALVVQLLRLWGVHDDFSPAALAAWPRSVDGRLDLTAVAGRYQLAVTELPATTLPELQAIGLPTILEVRDRNGTRGLLLRRMGGDSATLLTPAGEEIRFSQASLDGAWTRSAWFIWRNVDQVPSDPHQELNPIVLATLAVRLHKLGHLSPPLPAGNTDRFQQGVRRFQKAIGLEEDGIVGPRTTLALSRVIGGRFSPTIVADGR